MQALGSMLWPLIVILIATLLAVVLSAIVIARG